MRQFGSLHPNAQDVLEFDFSTQLLTGETLVFPPTITVEETTGADATPLNILTGGNSLDSTSRKLYVPVRGGTDGLNYLITAEIGTSDPKKRFVLPAILPIRKDPDAE